MSSYIHDSKHLNSIREATIDLFAYNRDFHKYPFRDFKLYVERDKTTTGEIEKIVNDLIEKLAILNVVAVSLQYKHHFEKEGQLNLEIKEGIARILDKKTGHKHLTIEGLYMALRSLSYQIEFERVKELTNEFDKPFEFLNTLIDGLAHEIAGKHTEGQEWSITND